jgi:hypothetical protein
VPCFYSNTECHVFIVMLSVIFLLLCSVSYIFIFMRSVTMLNDVMLSVTMLNDVVQRIMAPKVSCPQRLLTAN